MHNRYIIVTLISVMLIIGLLVSYGIYVNTASNAHVARLTAAQYSTVIGAAAAYRDLVPTLYFSSLKLQAGALLDIHLKIDGTIIKLFISPGDRVREGQLLAEIANDELPSQIVQAQSKINEATANYIKWDQTLQRYQGLVENGAISRQQMDEAIANRSVAMAEIASNQAYLEQLGTRAASQKIIAPRDGEVLKVYHSAGAAVQAGGSLAIIGDFSEIFVRVSLRDELVRPLLLLTGGFRLIMPEGQLRDKVYESGYRSANRASEREFNVTVASVEPPVDMPSPYRTVVWRVDNPAILLEPRIYSNVKITGMVKRSALAVPRAALMEENESAREATVFAVTADNRLEERPVRIGMRDDSYVEILQGLSANETVVVSGKIGLSTGMKVQVLPGTS